MRAFRAARGAPRLARVLRRVLRRGARRIERRLPRTLAARTLGACGARRIVACNYIHEVRLHDADGLLEAVRKRRELEVAPVRARGAHRRDVLVERLFGLNERRIALGVRGELVARLGTQARVVSCVAVQLVGERAA